MTTEDLERMTIEELEAWSEAADEGPDEDWPVGPHPRPRMTSVTMRMPVTLLEELKAEAAARKRKYQAYARDMMHLGLLEVKAGSDALPITVSLTEGQARQLAEGRTITLQLRVR